jgi:hypothetical protein
MRPEPKITLSGPNGGSRTHAEWCALDCIQGNFGIIGEAGPIGRPAANDNEARAANDNRRKTQSPFERMCDRRELDSDEDISELIRAAGKRYYSDWYMSGLGGLSGIDYSRVGGGGETSPAHYTPVSQRQAERRAAHRAARAALGDRYALIVEPIVLEDKSIGDLRGLAPMKDKTAASKFNMQKLREGMRRLAKHYDQCDAISLLDPTQRGGNSWAPDFVEPGNSHSRTGTARRFG